MCSCIVRQLQRPGLSQNKAKRCGFHIGGRVSNALLITQGLCQDMTRELDKKCQDLEQNQHPIWDVAVTDIIFISYATMLTTWYAFCLCRCHLQHGLTLTYHSCPYSLCRLPEQSRQAWLEHDSAGKFPSFFSISDKFDILQLASTHFMTSDKQQLKPSLFLFI